MEQRVEQRVAHLLHEIGGAGVAHEGCSGVAADDGPGEGRGNEGGLHRSLLAGLGQVHALVEAAEDDQGRLLMNQTTDVGVVCLLTGPA